MTALLRDGFEIPGEKCFWSAMNEQIAGWWEPGRTLGGWARRFVNGEWVRFNFEAGLQEIYVKVALKNNKKPIIAYTNFLEIYDEADEVLVACKWQQEGYPIQLHLGDNSIPLITTNYIVEDDKWFVFELHYKKAEVGGVVAVKIEGILDVSYTGDTNLGTGTQLGALKIGELSGDVNRDMCCDDAAINDSASGWCGDSHIIALRPNSNGDNTCLIGSDDQANNFELVDDPPTEGGTMKAPDGDATYTASSVSAYDLYHLQDSTLDNSVFIQGVTPVAIARNLAGDDAQIQVGIKSGDNEAWSGAKNTASDYTFYAGDTYTQNPANSENWQASDLDNLQVGLKVV